MRIFSADHEFDYSWDEVSTANWRKYCPWNKEASHVIAVDTLSRRLDPKSGVLRTERLITCKQSAPKWLMTFLGSSEVTHSYEVSYVTPPSAPIAQEEVKKAHEIRQNAVPQPPAPAVAEGRVTAAVAQTEQDKKSRSIWTRASSGAKRNLWDSPSQLDSQTSQNTPQPRTARQSSRPFEAASPTPSSSPPSSSTTSASTSTSPQTSLSTSTTPSTTDPITTHIPHSPALPNRPPTLEPPTAQPPTTALPSPPSHPLPRLPNITMLSTNLTYADLLSVRETVTYTPSPNSPDIHTGKTRFEQNARIVALCGGWQKVKERIEGFTVERFGQNAERGRVGFEGVLEMSRRVFGDEREREGVRRE